jgi:hypothetical protein
MQDPTKPIDDELGDMIDNTRVFTRATRYAVTMYALQLSMHQRRLNNLSSLRLQPAMLLSYIGTRILSEAPVIKLRIPLSAAAAPDK